MKAILCQKTLNSLLMNIEKDSKAPLLNYHIYPNRANLTRMLIQGNPISVCRISTDGNINQFAVLYKKHQRQVISWPYLTVNEVSTIFNYLTYKLYRLPDKEHEVNIDLENYGCLLLPLIDHNGISFNNGYPKYTIIDMN
jgi:hypothetical protein